MSGDAAGELVFFDTNVLVYAHDASEVRKRDIARDWLLRALGAGTLCTSTQALSEYFSVVTGKGEQRMDARAAGWLLEQLPAEAVVTPGLEVVRAAAARCAAGGLSIWEALIVEAARSSGAAVLLSEDARLRSAVDPRSDRIRVVDPFAEAPQISHVIQDALREALKLREERVARVPVRLTALPQGGGLLPGVDISSHAALTEALEKPTDDELRRRLQARRPT